MSSDDQPKLRGKAQARKSLYPLGEFPDDIVISIAKQIVHRLAVGNADIKGDDFGEIFANAVSGVHRMKPLGVTDVVWDGCSWSVKTVHNGKPFVAKKVRLISGRNSPDFSYGIENPREDVQKTGDAVLKIWNRRIDQSMNEHDDLRIVVLIRNINTLEFTLFEYEPTRYIPADYEWRVSKGGTTFWAYKKTTGEHSFVWQTHGAQFTVIKPIPGSAYKFRIKHHVGMLAMEHVLRLVQFKEDWVEKVE